ncbi:MAG: DUF533 domain-containing protein [bacterium]
MNSKVWLIPLLDALKRAPRVMLLGIDDQPSLESSLLATGPGVHRPSAPLEPIGPLTNPLPPIISGDPLSPADPIDPPPFDPWIAAELAARGYSRGLLADRLVDLGAPFDDTSIGFERYALINHAAQRMDIGQSWMRRTRRPDHARDPLRLLAALALAHDRRREADAIFALLDDYDPSARSHHRALNDVAAALGDRLELDTLPGDHPLLGHPFHQLLRYVDARCYARIARLVADAPDNRPRQIDLDLAHGLARSSLHHAVSAIIAVAAADGHVDDAERTLIDALMRAANFDRGEMASHYAEFDKPPDAGDLAARLDSEATRHFLLHLLCLCAHVSGRFDPRERRFILEFAAAAGEDAESLYAYEAEALATYERRPDLVERLRLDGTVSRLRRHLTRRLDRAIRDNTRRLWTEVQQTGELVQLIAKARTTTLTPAEEAAVKAQLVDVCKAIPALALFAVPGGSLLLPLVIRHLPFNLLPSSFAHDARLTQDLPPSIELEDGFDPDAA